MYRIIIFIFFISFSFSLYSFQLSQNSRISAITIGPSQKDLYSAFGHSGIRVKDDSLGIDYFYNYGVFDFEQPNFYINFLKGKLLYMVNRYNYKAVEDYYILNDRFVKEQILNLNLNQKLKIFQFLETNILSENKYYYYNYIYNNCATKIRDLFQEIIPGYVQYDSINKDNFSFRELMDLYLYDQKWGDLGIDICLGSEIDKIADNYHSMYLPDYLFSNLDNAKTSKNQNFILEENVIFMPNETKNYSIFLTPNFVLFVVLLLTIFLTFRERKYDLWYKKFDFMVFLFSGSIGLILVYLWFFTDHLSTYNYNLIWANPLNILAAFFLFNQKILDKIKIYFLIVFLLLLSLILLWFFLPQKLNISLIFLVLAILFRSIFVYFKLNNSSISN
ncbi:MAG: hypothetical protein CMF54_05105 [Legionellales bacterium]|nr:hypothetical protein [Legionellales bacterium]